MSAHDPGRAVAIVGWRSQTFPAGHLPREAAAALEAARLRMDGVDAALLDPQLVEAVLDARAVLDGLLADASGTPAPHLGVYAGCAFSGHFLTLAARARRQGRALDADLLRRHADKDYFAGRLAYMLRAHGPCWSIQAGCATGLHAMHAACGALAAGECDLALVVCASLTQGLDELEALLGGGTVEAPREHYTDAVACLALAREDDALARGWPVHARWLSSAVAAAGPEARAFGQASGSAMRSVAAEALALAGVAPPEIGYLELHAAGEAVAGVLERQSVASALGAPVRDLRWGSVKERVGHTGVASALFGVIHACCWLDAADSSAACAAVNAYGMTGCHAHAVLRAGARRAAGVSLADSRAALTAAGGAYRP